MNCTVIQLKHMQLFSERYPSTVDIFSVTVTVPDRSNLTGNGFVIDFSVRLPLSGTVHLDWYRTHLCSGTHF